MPGCTEWTEELPAEGRALLARVRELVPRLAGDAAEAERLRRPTDAQIRWLEEAGVFRTMVPHAYGGLELDLDTFVEVGLALAEADVSIAWVTSFCIEHNWMFCQFPETFQKQLYAGADHVLAPAVIAPTGRALPENGGYRVTGRWSWGTGVMHASWVILGCLTQDAPDPTSMRFLALPISDVRVDDVWHVDGMAATGSNDIVVEDVIVPEERSVALVDLLEGRAHGAKLHRSPLYHTPMIPILLVAASTPIVGRATQVARAFGEALKKKVRINAPGGQAERASAQMRLAQATLEARQAELLLRDVVREVCVLRDGATREQRVRWAASISHAVHQARRAIQDVVEAAGASAHFLHHPLQRSLRDVQVASCHVAFDHDAQREVYGRTLLGLETPPGLF